MAAVSPMEGVDIAIRIANVVKLFKERRHGLHALQAMLEKYQQMFEQLKATGLDTGDVAMEVSQTVLQDLERCKARLDDRSWLNKVNVKNAIDEKKDAEAIRERLERDLQRLHTELMLALHHRDRQQFQQILTAQIEEARKCEIRLEELQRKLRADGDDNAEDTKRRIDSLKITLSILQASLQVGQAQVLEQGQQHFAVLKGNHEQMMQQSHVHMEQNQKQFVALQDSHAAIMERSEEQFKCLDEQGKQTLKEVREGFVQNKQLLDDVKEAVHSEGGNVLGAIHKLSQTSNEYQCNLLAKLQEVLHEVQQGGVAVTAETAELAMNSEV